MALGKTPEEIVKSEKYSLLNKHASWLRVFISDIAIVQNGYAFSSTYFTKEKGKPLIRIRDISNNKTENYYSGEYDDDYIVKIGDILIGMDGDFNAYYWNGPEGLLNQRVCRIILKSQLYSNDFLFLCLQPYLDAINAETSSVTVKHLSSITIGNIPLPLPALAEQNRIVQKFDSLIKLLEKGEESLKNVQYQLKLYRESILQKAFTGQLTEQWRSVNKYADVTDLTRLLKIHRQKYYEDQIANWEETVYQWQQEGKRGKKPTKPRALKNYSPFTDKQVEELPTLPDSWTWIKLGEISEIVGGVTKGRKLAGKETMAIPYLRVANVQDGYLDLNEIKEIEVLPEDVTKYQLESGDVLYIEGGDKDKLGRGTIWNNELPNCIHQNHVFRSRVINRKMNAPEFIAYNSQTQVARSYFFENAKQTVNLASINMTVLSELPVPLCSIEEQQEILFQLEKSFKKQEELNYVLDSALRDAQILRQSILKKAFEGKLVHQNPDDEPARELLRKIQKEKKKWQESQKEKKKISKPKTRMEALTIEQVLKKAKEPISAKELWEASKHKHDIEEFYLELKKLGDRVIEIKSKTESLLRLEDAN